MNQVTPDPAGDGRGSVNVALIAGRGDVAAVPAVMVNPTLSPTNTCAASAVLLKVRLAH
jgi:hypothetical protein